MICSVRDLQPAEKKVFEQTLGQVLGNDQQLRIEVLPASQHATDLASTEPHLPDWCDVYAGLTDEEIAELEVSILDRSHWSR